MVIELRDFAARPPWNAPKGMRFRFPALDLLEALKKGA